MPFPVDTKWLIAMEQEMGLTFPPLYRGKLLKENGGELTTSMDAWQLFPVLDQSDRKRIARTCNSIASETKKHLSWPRFPAAAVAIGNNGFGDVLILLPESSNSKILSDVIYWWNHETGAVEKLADDIAEILADQREELD